MDDLLVHKISDAHYLLCVNAGNQDSDFAHIVEHNKFGAQVENAATALLAARDSGAAREETYCSGSRPSRSDPIRYYHFDFRQSERRATA